MNEHKPGLHQIKETCLYVSDLDTTRSFYEDILGLEVIHYKPGRHLFFKVGKDVLLFFNPDATATDEELPPHHGKGEQHVAFECSKEEYEQWKLHLGRHQIEIEKEVDWPNGGKSFYFRDPERLCLEIVQPGIWGF